MVVLNHCQRLSAISLLAISLLAGWSNALASPASDGSPARSRLGINLSAPVDWNTELPFVDVFRLARPWISQQTGRPWGQGPALSLDADGWVQSLADHSYAETPVLTGGHAPVGDYVCLYEGAGRLEFGANSIVIDRQPGRILVHINAQHDGTFVQLRETDPTNPIRHIRLVMPGFESTFAHEPFSPTFLNRWRGFNTARFMDWEQINSSAQRDWNDRPKPGDASWSAKGMPVEVMIDLCNRLKINPWFCLPHAATDDYVRQFAELVSQRLDPSLKVYVEYSNEVWNNQFPQHTYALDQARQRGLGPPERPWEGAALFYARRAQEIFQIWTDAFGGHQRLIRVLAWQAASGAYWTDHLLLSQQNTAQNCDALAIAPYLTFLPGPSGQPLNSDEVSKWTLDRVLDYVTTNSLPESLGWIKTQKAVADKYGLTLVAYEAGQHLVGVGGGENNDALTRLLIAANQSPRMGEIYTRYLDGWRQAGGGLMCLFSSVSTSSKWGSWGLLEGADETDSPKFNAVLQWNQTNLR